MFDKIQDLEIRFQEIESMLSDPTVIANQPEFRKPGRVGMAVSCPRGMDRNYIAVDGG
jgi:peptide chain release factor 1